MSTTSTGIKSFNEVKHICATCQFWHAETREIVYNGRTQQSISVDIHENNYDSYCEVMNNHAHKSLSASCSKWQKWNSIQD